jgi:hypothetical protein
MVVSFLFLFIIIILVNIYSQLEELVGNMSILYMQVETSICIEATKIKMDILLKIYIRQEIWMHPKNSVSLFGG